MKIPDKVTKGDYLAWIDHPTTDNLGNTLDSTSWTLKYALRGASELTLTASAEGSGWKTEISTAQSGALTVGVYYWQAFVVHVDNRKITLGNGRIEVLAGLDTISGAYDGRSQIRKDLDSVQAAIRSLVSGGIQEYTIGNRSFRKIDLGELRALESKLKFDLNKEERAERMKAGLGDPFNTYVRFK